MAGASPLRGQKLTEQLAFTASPQRARGTLAELPPQHAGQVALWSLTGMRAAQVTRFVDALEQREVRVLLACLADDGNAGWNND